MKVLVLSNVPGGVDNAVSLLESQHSVTAKEATMTSRELADAAGAQLSSGSYAMAVIIAKDPVAVSLALNKKDGVTAVVCNSAEEAQLARQNSANAVVLAVMERDRLGEVLALAVSGSGVLKRIGAIATKVQPPREQAQPVAKQAPDPKAQKAIVQERARRQQSDAEEERPQQQPRSGIMGKLKDYLGIV